MSGWKIGVLRNYMHGWVLQVSEILQPHSAYVGGKWQITVKKGITSPKQTGHQVEIENKTLGYTPRE